MIELIGGYCVRADSKQYIAGKPKTGNDGIAHFRDPHYFPTMAQAVRHVGRECLRDKVAADEITTLNEFLREATEIKESLIKKLNELEV